MRSHVGRILFSPNAFGFFEKLGIHLTSVHYYSPIPDTRELRASGSIWEQESPLAGVDLNDQRQLTLLREFQAYSRECEFPLDRTSTPHEYFARNPDFSLADASMLHCMIRSGRPKRIIEVGSGFSTYVSARACLINQDEGCATGLAAIEPYPNPVLRAGIPGLAELISTKVEHVGIDVFTSLEEGDILFIDSSHVVRMGNDVVFLFLEVLPQLKKGTIVHVHDIFLPKPYPRPWVMNIQRFWSEQYLLQAFLAFNSHFEVLWGGNFSYEKHRDDVVSGFPLLTQLAWLDQLPSSFWIRKTA